MKRHLQSPGIADCFTVTQLSPRREGANNGETCYYYHLVCNFRPDMTGEWQVSVSMVPSKEKCTRLLKTVRVLQWNHYNAPVCSVSVVTVFRSKQKPANEFCYLTYACTVIQLKRHIFSTIREKWRKKITLQDFHKSQELMVKMMKHQFDNEAAHEITHSTERSSEEVTARCNRL